MYFQEVFQEISSDFANIDSIGLSDVLELISKTQVCTITSRCLAVYLTPCRTVSTAFGLRPTTRKGTRRSA